MKKIEIDGVDYVDGEEAARLLNNLISIETVRVLGRDWRRQKVGNRWFYCKEDLALPYYPLAKWQKMVFTFMYAVVQDKGDETAMGEIRRLFDLDDYYNGMSFLRGAGYEMIVTGGLETYNDKATYTLGLVGQLLGGSSRPLLVVAYGKEVGGKFLTKAEFDACWRKTKGKNCDFVSWDVREVACEMMENLTNARPG